MIMKNFKALLSTLLMIVLTTFLSFAQKDAITSKSFSIEPFTSVKSDVVATIIYTQSDDVSMKAKGEKDMVDKLKIKQRNGLIEISRKKKFSFRKKSSVVIYLSSPSIESIEIDGVGTWQLNGKVKTDNLTINSKGVGKFEALDLETNTVSLKKSGVGSITLKGVADSIKVISDGVGGVDTKNLNARYAKVNSSGVGSVKCFASDGIDLHNNGVGSIIYYGNPEILSLENSGVGGIKKANN